MLQFENSRFPRDTDEALQYRFSIGSVQISAEGNQGSESDISEFCAPLRAAAEGPTIVTYC